MVARYRATVTEKTTTASWAAQGTTGKTRLDSMSVTALKKEVVLYHLSFSEVFGRFEN